MRLALMSLARGELEEFPVEWDLGDSAVWRKCRVPSPSPWPSRRSVSLARGVPYKLWNGNGFQGHAIALPSSPTPRPVLVGRPAGVSLEQLAARAGEVHGLRCRWRRPGRRLPRRFPFEPALRKESRSPKGAVVGDCGGGGELGPSIDAGKPTLAGSVCLHSLFPGRRFSLEQKGSHPGGGGGTSPSSRMARVDAARSLAVLCEPDAGDSGTPEPRPLVSIPGVKVAPGFPETHLTPPTNSPGLAAATYCPRA